MPSRAAAAAAAFFALPVLAQDAPPASFVRVLDAQLKERAANYLSQRFDVLDVKYVRPDGTGRNEGWGVNYRWDAEKSDARLGEIDGRFAMRALSYSVAIDGSYAFSDADNNQDWSTAQAAVRLERGDFGALRPVPAEQSAAFQDCLAALPEDSDDAAEQQKIEEQEAECWVDFRLDESDAYYYWLDFHGGIEGNQDYDDSHTVFGLSAAYAREPSAATARFNVLDWPFRALRNAFGDGGHYVAPFPSLAVSLERVDASSDDVRRALTSDANYTRGAAEIAFQSIVANFGGRPLRFNVSYRYFHEFSAPDAIKAADLDRFDFLRATLRFPAHLLPFFASDQYELFVGYTHGQLPFDQRSDSAFELGIATNIALLGELLQQ